MEEEQDLGKEYWLQTTNNKEGERQALVKLKQIWISQQQRVKQFNITFCCCLVKMWTLKEHSLVLTTMVMLLKKIQCVLLPLEVQEKSLLYFKIGQYFMCEYAHAWACLYAWVRTYRT